MPKDEDQDENGEEEDMEEEKTDEMKRYEKETGKYAVWRGVVTEGFKKWQKGEKIYDRDKERISLYVSEETKNKWQDFINNHDYGTISKLIRDSVKLFIDDHLGNNPTIDQLNPQTISNISHALKEPLTSIKGYSQLLLENFNEKLSENVRSTVKNILEQSILLENKIKGFLDDIRVQAPEYDILLIEDDFATIRLITSLIESKGYSCKGVITGAKGIEEIKASAPKVILLDIILPDISGYDICKTIKSDKRYSKIPIFFLTAMNVGEVEENLKETGADGYILKPFNLSDFEKIFQLI